MKIWLGKYKQMSQCLLTFVLYGNINFNQDNISISAAWLGECVFSKVLLTDYNLIYQQEREFLELLWAIRDYTLLNDAEMEHG